jgi:hypothetical protein
MAHRPPPFVLIRSPLCRAVQIRTNTITTKIGQQWNTQFEQNGTRSGVRAGLG